jgi:steroid delta-isomerase-like uncharacterized protein
MPDRQKKGSVSMSAEETKNLIRHRFENAEYDQEAWLALFDPQCSFPHLVAYGLPPTLEGYKKFVAAAYGSFTDGQDTVEETVAEDEKVMVWAVHTATHSGPWRNIPATNKRVSFRVVAFFRLAHSKIVECRILYDTFSFLQQAGPIPGLQA